MESRRTDSLRKHSVSGGERTSRVPVSFSSLVAASATLKTGSISRHALPRRLKVGHTRHRRSRHRRSRPRRVLIAQPGTTKVVVLAERVPDPAAPQPRALPPRLPWCGGADHPPHCPCGACTVACRLHRHSTCCPPLPTRLCQPQPHLVKQKYLAPGAEGKVGRPPRHHNLT